jgi:hypothetical protein
VTDISPEVRQFVVERIHSVAQLELLLVLRRDPSVEWTVPMASAEMRYPRDWVAEQLLPHRMAAPAGETPSHLPPRPMTS